MCIWYDVYAYGCVCIWVCVDMVVGCMHKYVNCVYAYGCVCIGGLCVCMYVSGV